MLAEDGVGAADRLIGACAAVAAAAAAVRCGMGWLAPVEAGRAAWGDVFMEASLCGPLL